MSSLLLVGATPFLLHLIERISFYPRSWVRNMLRGGHMEVARKMQKKPRHEDGVRYKNIKYGLKHGRNWY